MRGECRYCTRHGHLWLDLTPFHGLPQRSCGRCGVRDPPDTFRVGDIVSVRGATVPLEYWDALMRVTSVDAVTGLPTMQLLPRDETPAQLRERAMSALRRAQGGAI